MYKFIRIGEKIQIGTYGLVFMAGYVLAVVIGMKMAEKRGDVDKYDVLYSSVFAIIGVGIGAKLLFAISKIPVIIEKFDVFSELVRTSLPDAFSFLFSGMVFYGGLIGGCAGIYFYCRRYRVDIWKLAGIFAPLIPFVHAFGRISCFLAGCCYGIPYDGIYAVSFPYDEDNPLLSEVSRFPVQLLESLLNFTCASILFRIYSVKIRAGVQQLGKILLSAYLLYYTVARFLLEYLRGDALRGFFGPFSTSQTVSIILFPFALYLCISGRKKSSTVL